MPGRSLPFDQLLAAFNSKSHAGAVRPPACPLPTHNSHAFPGKGGGGALLAAQAAAAHAAASAPPPPPDPEWVAEWQRKLRVLPPLVEAARAAVSSHLLACWALTLTLPLPLPLPLPPTPTPNPSPNPNPNPNPNRTPHPNQANFRDYRLHASHHPCTPLYVAEPGRKRHRLWGIPQAELATAGDNKPAKKPKERKPKAPKATDSAAVGPGGLGVSSPTQGLNSPGGMAPLRPVPTLQRSLSMQNAASMVGMHHQGDGNGVS